jgi:hypothetical protein
MLVVQRPNGPEARAAIRAAAAARVADLAVLIAVYGE